MINQKPCLTVLVWDVKEPTHSSKRIGDFVPGVMAYHLFCSGDTCTCVDPVILVTRLWTAWLPGADPENSERWGRDPYPPPTTNENFTFQDKQQWRNVNIITGKNNGFPFLDILGYLKNTNKTSKFCKVWQVPTREFPNKFPDWDLSPSSKSESFVDIL